MPQPLDKDASYWAEVVGLVVVVCLIVGFMVFVLQQAFCNWQQ